MPPCHAFPVKRPSELVDGSRTERRLVLLLCVVLVAASVGTAFLVDERIFKVIGALPTVVLLFLAYATVVGAVRTTTAATEQAEAERLDAAAAVVSIRMAGLVPVETVDGTRVDVSVEIQNHGSLPVRLIAVRPTLGSVNEKTPLPVPQAVTQTLLWRIPPAAESSGDSDRNVTLGLTVQNLTRTVTDDYRLTFDLRSYGHPGMPRTWTVEKDPGYAELVQRSRTDFPTAPVEPLRRQQKERVGPAGPESASPVRPPSPRGRLAAGSRRP